MDPIDRMFNTLVRTLRAKQPALLKSPFTVGELHQHILPYRHYRRELEMETNQEYELVLMQLLAGERGYLDVDERLRDGLGKELRNLSPEPSRVREFADAQVSVNASAQAKVPASTSPAGGSDAVRNSTPATQRASTVNERTDASRCRYCGGDLPPGRTMNYCPHCGQNLQLINCTACGAEVEAGWKFCVACGKAVV
jgi:hypothetical protein